MQSRLGDYVRFTDLGGGQVRACYVVPEHQRPSRWQEEMRLPAVGPCEGFLVSAEFRKRLQASIDSYDRQVERFNLTRALDGDFSVRTLAKLYRQESRLEFKYVDLKEVSRKRNESYIEKIAQWADSRGNLSFADITWEELREFLDHYAPWPTTQLHFRSVLNQLMMTAKYAGWRSDNPLKGDKWTPPVPKQQELWTQADIDEYAAEAEAQGNPGLAAMFKVYPWFVQRLADMRLMEHSRSYEDGEFAIVQRKTNILVGGDVIDKVDEYLQGLRVPGSNFVFNHPKSKTAYTEVQLGIAFVAVRRAIYRPGKKWLIMKSLRHSFVAMQVAAKVHPFDIAELTGHKHETVYKIMERYKLRKGEGAMRAARAYNQSIGGSDADFSRVGGKQRRFVTDAKPASTYRGGVDRSRLRQFARRYWKPEEVEAIFSENNPEVLAKLAALAGHRSQAERFTADRPKANHEADETR